MSDARHADYEALPLEAARRVDRVCDRFEQAWLAGRRPRAEDFLGEVEEPDRPALLAELLLVERGYAGVANAPSTDNLTRATATPPPAGGAPAPPPARAPRTVGKYRVVERLGAGGQGEVFRAYHPELRCDVAVKWARHTLPPELQRRLLDEAQVLARLDDPGVVRVHDAGTHEGRPFVVFAYAPGRTLAERLRQGRPSFRQAAALTAEVARTLDRLHGRGILHRDLKPANVLLDADRPGPGGLGAPRLLDFGLASLTRPWERINPPEEDGVCGTYQYMAPEQARGQADRIGPRIDLFGLGGVLYELLTGRPPYPGPDADSAAWQARRGGVTPPRRLDRRIPRALERICLKALAPDPECRYGSAAEMEQALRSYLRRPRLLFAGLASLLTAAVLLAVTLLLARGPAGGATAPGDGGRAVLPLAGELRLRVWSRDAPRKQGEEVGKDFGTLPVRNGEQLRLEARLNQPAHVYLLWLDSEGVVTPLYPWNAGHRIDRKDLGAAPPLPPQCGVSSPGDRPDGRVAGWKVGGKSGLDTILLLACREPLPPSFDLAGVIGKAPATRLRDPLEYAVCGADEGRPVDEVSAGQARGPDAEAAVIDEPLVQLMGRLRRHFPLVRAVRFAHQGSD